MPLWALWCEQRLSGVRDDHLQHHLLARRARARGSAALSSPRESGGGSSAFQVASRAVHDGAASTCRRTGRGPSGGLPASSGSARPGTEPAATEIACGVPSDLQQEIRLRQTGRRRPRFGHRPSGSAMPSEPHNSGRRSHFIGVGRWIQAKSGRDDGERGRVRRESSPAQNETNPIAVPSHHARGVLEGTYGIE